MLMFHSHVDVYQRVMGFHGIEMMIWRLPNIGIPQNHPFIDGICHYHPANYWGAQISVEASWEYHRGNEIWCAVVVVFFLCTTMVVTFISWDIADPNITKFVYLCPFLS